MAISMPTHMPAETTGKTCVPKREKMCAAMMRFVCGENRRYGLCGAVLWWEAEDGREWKYVCGGAMTK
jgi:hypothetical protein